MKKRKLQETSVTETNETRNLSNVELQRLVLLEQLEVLRIKKRRLLAPVIDNYHLSDITVQNSTDENQPQIQMNFDDPYTITSQNNTLWNL